MVDGKNKCPNCGATLSGLELKCPECGYILVKETSASQNTTESILILQDKLLAVDKVFSLERSSKKKASIINSFPIPNTAEALVRFLHFSYSNFEAAKEAGDKKLSMAWLGKAIESYRRLSESKNDKLVATAIEQYSALGDKKAFSKLSGSRKKRRIILISIFAFLALIAAFVLWFDWAGYLMKRGKVDAAINALSFTGRKAKAIDLLIDNGYYLQAAEMLSSSGRSFDAVSLLAQKGEIMEALMIAAKTNCSDSIHLCVDEIEKYFVLNTREKFYPEDRLRILKLHLAETYDNCRYRVKRIIDPKDSSAVIWEDVWKINASFVFPDPQIMSYYSPFQKLYRRYGDWGRYPTPHVEFNRLGKIEYISIGNDQGVLFPLEFFFSYSTDDVQLFRETIRYNGIPFYQLAYEYDDTGQSLKRVRMHCLFDDYEEFFKSNLGDSADDMIEALEENKTDIIKAAQALELYHLSATDSYRYENGKLVEITTSQDFDKDHHRIEQILYKQFFNYHDNMVIWETATIDPTTGDEALAPDKHIIFICDGIIIEDFMIEI